MEAARPVRLTPWLEPKPWGGRRLERWHIALPPYERIGEAHLAAANAVVASGAQAGRTLGELTERDPAAWIGARGLEATGGRQIFPLLVKLIAAETDLSIQVHPDDHAAAAAGLGTGKTEAWHVLAAPAGAGVYLGLASDDEQERFAAACRLGDGSAAPFLRRVPVTPGDTLIIPAGTVHAICADLVVYEIQQPSDVTFRLDDWGRRDASGALRPLNHAAGLEVLDPASRPEPLPRATLASGVAARQILAATRPFALERIAFSGQGAVALPLVQSPQVITTLAGTATLEAAGTTLTLALGETAAIPVAAPATLQSTAGSVLLRGWVPDLARDIIAPALAAGLPADLIGRLGVPTEALPPPRD